MILYHGSTSRYDVLIPHQAYDTGFVEGCQNAVYATSEKAMAIGFALGAKVDENGELEREMMPQYGYKMVFRKGSPDYGGKGYIYVLDGSKFVHAMGSQWVCFEPIEPLEVIEINVDDYLEYAIVAREYLKNPCGTYSIPYWKQKRIQIPENMKILHDREFEQELLLEYNEEKYFRLMHDLKDIKQAVSNEFYIETASVKDIPLLQDLINRSYDDLSVSYDQLLSYTKSEVYDENLWMIVYEKETDKPVACGIAEFDREIKEGVLEWIQVLPEYRGRKIGQLLVNELLTRLQRKADFVTVSGKVDNLTKPELLYRKCGFTGEDIWHVLTKKGSQNDRV